jgi:hypothetical protein
MDQTEPLILRVDGLLDLEHAREIVRRLQSAPDDVEVVIEFSPRIQCAVVPLSLVAEAIAHRGSPVAVRGLSHHDIRILRYLGVTLPSKDEPASSG